jgi:23S rRNA (cytidine1920-2'-O)/16S rRNA (cytidine1409-2'-O)-methyltransferase
LRDLVRRRRPELDSDEVFSLIAGGRLLVDGERVRDPARLVSANAELREDGARYVSRGGEKLEGAVSAWRLPVSGRVFIDAGASTGGFTDCLLRHGAELVYAVDVGYNQLDYRLRVDPRVVALERTNVLDLNADSFSRAQPQAAVADLSFRSLGGVVSHLVSLTTESWVVGLIKPQFEADPANSEDAFDGVVRDPEARGRRLLSALDACAAEGVYAYAVMAAPIRGRRGNQEYLCLFGPEGLAFIESEDREAPAVSREDREALVSRAVS